MTSRPKPRPENFALETFIITTCYDCLAEKKVEKCFCQEYSTG